MLLSYQPPTSVLVINRSVLCPHISLQKGILQQQLHFFREYLPEIINQQLHFSDSTRNYKREKLSLLQCSVPRICAEWTLFTNTKDFWWRNKPMSPTPSEFPLVPVSWSSSSHRLRELQANTKVAAVGRKTRTGRSLIWFWWKKTWISFWWRTRSCPSF